MTSGLWRGQKFYGGGAESYKKQQVQHSILHSLILLIKLHFV